MRIKEIGEKFDVKNVFDLVDKEIKGKFEINYLTKQQITKYKRHGSKLIENKKYMYAHECIFFSIWIFSHDHSRIAGLQGKGEGISLTSHYHFHPLHRRLDISQVITAESSPLHIASSQTRTGNL